MAHGHDGRAKSTGFSALMSDDVVFLTPGQEPFGRKRSPHPPVAPRRARSGSRPTGEVQEVQIVGDTAYCRTCLRRDSHPGAGSQPMRLSGHTLSDPPQVVPRPPAPDPDANLLMPEPRRRTPREVTPFLMFEGTAEEAMNLYVSLFPGSAIKRVEHTARESPGRRGRSGWPTSPSPATDLMCIDSPVKHAFTFTPSVSLFVECESEADSTRRPPAVARAGRC